MKAYIHVAWSPLELTHRDDLNERLHYRVLKKGSKKLLQITTWLSFIQFFHQGSYSCLLVHKNLVAVTPVKRRNCPDKVMWTKIISSITSFFLHKNITCDHHLDYLVKTILKSGHTIGFWLEKNCCSLFTWLLDTPGVLFGDHW